MEIVRCPNCSAELNVCSGGASVPADRVLIDKLTYRQRNPVRGDVVALWDPFVSGRLIIKRIVGLPNENIEFVEGQVYVDGSPVGFTVGESLTTVNDDRYRRSNVSRWEELDDAKWRKTRDGFSIDARGDTEDDYWLAYKHSSLFTGTERGSIYDDNFFNLSVSRKLNVTTNLFVSGHAVVDGEGSFYLRCAYGDQTWTCQYDVGANDWSIVEQQPRVRKTLAKTDVAFRLALQSRSVRFTAGGIDASQEFSSPSAAGATQFLIGASNLKVELTDLIVQRAPYTTLDSPKPVTAVSWQLGASEYFLLGDNSPISVDSRYWQRMIRRSDLIGIVRHY